MKVLASLLVASLAIATPVAAAPVGGPSSALSLEALRNYGACIVRTSPGDAVRVLGMDYRTPAYRDALQSVGRGHSRCITPGRELRSDGVLFAASLAEALLTQVTRAPLAASLAYDAGKPPIEARSQSEVMALCVVRRDPAAVARLVGTVPGTPEENSALATISSYLPACLANGASIKLNRPALRALIALGAYRVAVANGAVRGADPLHGGTH